MFTEKIISKIGYLETSLPVRGFFELIENINGNDSDQDFNANLAGQIQIEKYVNQNLIPLTIQNQIFAGCHQYIKTFGHNTLEYIKNSNYRLNFLNSWINFQKKCEYNPIHNHNGDLVFVIWIKIPYLLKDELEHISAINSNRKVASKFEFTNVASRFSNFNDTVINVDDTYEGKMIIFHSGMEHTVYPFFTSDDYRISMSGNLSIVFDE